MSNISYHNDGGLEAAQMEIEDQASNNLEGSFSFTLFSATNMPMLKCLSFAKRHFRLWRVIVVVMFFIVLALLVSCNIHLRNNSSQVINKMEEVLMKMKNHWPGNSFQTGGK